MRLLTVGIVLALAALSGLVSTAPASPLDLEQVSAEAKWVAHIDIDATLKTTLFEKGLEKMLETNEAAEGQLKELRDRIGMDVTKDVHAVTAYGTKLGDDNGVLIVNAKFDKAKLLGMAKEAPDYKVSKHGAYEVHSWTGQQRGGLRTMSAAFFKSTIVVASSNPEDLNAALDVLAGKQPGVFPDSPLSGKVAPGTALVMRVSGLSEAELPGRMQMLRKINLLQVAMGEDDGKMFIRADAEMADTETVEQATAMIGGLRALATQATAENEQAKKLLGAVKVSSDDKTLTIKWSMPADEIWEMADDFSDRAAERRSRRRPGGSEDGS